MTVHRESETIEHKTFRDLSVLIPAGDAIVLNTTRVYRARLLGTRDSGAPAEVLLLKPLGDDRYEAMVHPGGKLKPGRRVHVSPDLEVEILEATERRTRIVRLRSTLPLDEAIERYGHTPLPPYIERPDEIADSERYQTVYARESGSVAAPTAGLHFTEQLLSEIEKRRSEASRRTTSCRRRNVQAGRCRASRRSRDARGELHSSVHNSDHSESSQASWGERCGRSEPHRYAFSRRPSSPTEHSLSAAAKRTYSFGHRTTFAPWITSSPTFICRSRRSSCSSPRSRDTISPCALTAKRSIPVIASIPTATRWRSSDRVELLLQRRARARRGAQRSVHNSARRSRDTSVHAGWNSRDRESSRPKRSHCDGRDDDSRQRLSSPSETR